MAKVATQSLVVRLAALRRLIRMRGLPGFIGSIPQRRLLMALGIAGALLVGGLANHIRATSASYQVEAARHGVALMMTLRAQQETRRLLGGLARVPFGADAQAQLAVIRAASMTLRETLADLAALPARPDASGLTALQQALPGLIDTADHLGRLVEAAGEDLAAAAPHLLTLIDAMDAPLHEALARIERDGRDLAHRSMLDLAGRLLVFALGFLLLVASSAVLVGLLVVAWRRAGAAVTTAQAAEREALAAHGALDVLLESVPALISTFDLDLRCRQANRAVREMFALPGGEHGDPAVLEVQRSGDLEASLSQVRETGLPIAAQEHEVRDAEGRLRHLVTSTVPLFDADGRLYRILRTSLDVTGRHEAEQQMRHLAQHDALTDLPNRLRFKHVLENRLARAAPALALHIVNLDGFHLINDTHGQAAGDDLLLAAARRLRGLVRRSDMLARLGGDEFALLQPLAAPGEATTMAARITQALAQPYRLAGLTVRCSASLGVAVLMEGAASAESMLSRAELALASARRDGIGRFMTFRAEMEGEALERRGLKSELALALSRGELHLDYQPKFNLADGDLEGVEALLRWHHPQRGPVSPAEFVPLAEEAGLALPLARFVLDRAAAQVHAWLAQGLRIPVAVNLSAELIGTDDALRMIEAVLAESGIPASLLEIEVTESTFIGDSQAARDMLSSLRAMGIRIALDDFGTGFSSLAYLQELPIDVLKVDRCFVAGLGRADGGASGRIVETVVRLAHGLGARVVAEGVETEAQLEALRRLGCDMVQGFLVGRPQAAETIPALPNRARPQQSLAIPA